MHKITYLLFFVAIGFWARAQPVHDLIPAVDLIQEGNDIPSDFYNERVAVVLMADPSIDWDKTAMAAHRYLKKMGIDAVAYFLDQDLCASLIIRSRFASMMNMREIKTLLFIKVNKDTYQLLIVPFNGTLDFISPNDIGWLSAKGTLNDAFLSLGLKISQSRLPQDQTNFLVPELPQKYHYLPLEEGLVLQTYPSQLRRVKLAVELKDSLEIKPGYPNSVQTRIRQYNQAINAQNNRLIALLKNSYPYSFDTVYAGSDNELYRNGYQYVLRSLNTKGRNIKMILSLPIDDNETDFITVKPGNGSGVDLIRIPVETNVSKYYIKQTVAKDLYVGKHWDADIHWEESLLNFVFNLSEYLK
jgi:hypothetical protein